MYCPRFCLVENKDRYPDVDNIVVDSIYTSMPKPLRLLRLIHHKLNFLPKTKVIWLGNWKKYVKNAKEIIIFDSIFDYFPLEYIRKKNPDCKIIFCYRNRIKESVAHNLISRSPDVFRNNFNAEMFSYSKEDCKYYDMIYYPQFHIIPVIATKTDHKICRDVYFIGVDKNRLGTLKSLAKVFNDNNISFLFEVIPSKNEKYSSEDAQYLTKRKPYGEVIKNVLSSKCILEIVGNQNKGITYRALEAMMLNRKLITNYAGISDSEFYNPDNVFILGKDKNLPDFINKPIDKSDIDPDKFSFQNFCNNIFDSLHPDKHQQ